MEILSGAANGCGVVRPVVASTRGLLVTSWSATGVFADITRNEDIRLARAKVHQSAPEGPSVWGPHNKADPARGLGMLIIS